MPDLRPEEMRVSGRGGTLRRPEAPVRLGPQVMETIPVRRAQKRDVRLSPALRLVPGSGKGWTFRREWSPGEYTECSRLDVIPQNQIIAKPRFDMVHRRVYPRRISRGCPVTLD